ncbi:ATP-binding protein [Nonomuraea sp. NPDC052265]|uniref:ATP-binding protein n=1 Tax=Nonomuraea sp. NPDC052265 TaxID=3364374 RepID=UPI0037CC9CF4
MSEPSPGAAASWPISRDLAALRDLVRRHALQAGLASQRGDDLALAANEAVTNVLDHAGGAGWVRIWADDDFLTVDVGDQAGRLRPDACPEVRPQAGPGGYGLWVMRRLCDEFVITQTSASSQVRLRMKRARVPGRAPTA